MSENGVIGKDNRLPWHIPGDLKHFKQTTLGKPVIMGRKSYESLGRPLPGRDNIVVSRKYKTLDGFQPTSHFDDMEAVGERVETKDKALLVSDIETAVSEAKKLAAAKGLDEIFITGGAEIYKAAMPLTDRIYLTVVHRDYEGDTYFHGIDMKDWRETGAQRHEGDPPYTIKVLERA
jgi:dihydrofolate reductase